MIFSCVALSLPSVNVAELVIRTAKSCAKSWTSYKSCLAFSFLVELTVYIKRNMGSQPLHVAMSSSDDHMLLRGTVIDADFVVSHSDLSPLPRFVSSLILNHLTMLVKELKGLDRRKSSFSVLQWQYLLSQRIRIVQEYPILAGELLDGVKAVAEVMVSRDDNPRVVIACSRGDNSSMGTNSNAFCGDGSISPPLSGEDENPTISELAFYIICSFLGDFLETLDGKNILTSEIAQMVRSLTGFICQGGTLNSVSGLRLMNGMRTLEHSMKVCDKLAEEADRMNENFNVLEYRSKLSKAFARVCAGEEMLVQAITLDGPPYFQSWFLKLRVKFLQNMIDLSGLLDIEHWSACYC